MKATILFFCALLAANSLLAQNYSIIERQARNVAAGQPPQGSTPPQNNNPPASPPNPALEATLKNISNLRVDFDALGKLSDLQTNSPQAKLLLNDLTIAAQGSKPSDTSISALADALAAAVIGKTAMQPQHAKLAQDIHAVFNASHLSPEQQQKIFDDVQKILQDGGATADDAIAVISSIKTIAAETK